MENFVVVVAALFMLMALPKIWLQMPQSHFIGINPKIKFW